MKRNLGGREIYRENQLLKMRKLAISLQEELMQEESAIGSFIFGSVATKTIHERSDLDLAVVFKEEATNYQQGREIREIDGIKVEIWRYSAKYYAETFETEEMRNKSDTWMWTPLWIEQMQQGEILSDPNNRLVKWKESAENWVWRENEINPLEEKIKENLRISKNFSSKGKLLLALVAFREANTCLAAAKLMKENLLPSFRAKDLCRNLMEIQDKEKKLLELFSEINDIPINRSRELDENFKRLTKFVDEIWGQEQRGPRTELNNVNNCLLKQDISGAWLSIRYTAYWLGYTIVNRREKRIVTKLCDADNHTKMIQMLESEDPTFFQFYEKIHSIDKWNLEKLESIQNRFEKLL